MAAFSWGSDTAAGTTLIVLPLNTLTLKRSRLSASSALKLHFTSSYSAWGSRRKENESKDRAKC